MQTNFGLIFDGDKQNGTRGVMLFIWVVEQIFFKLDFIILSTLYF